MKTALKAKVIIESKLYKSWNEDGSAEELSLNKIINHINSGKIEVEAIDDGLTNHTEPVLIIKLK